MTKVSCFTNCFQTRPASNELITDLLNSIGDIQHERRHLIAQIRQCEDKTARDELKNQLPAATFSGIFEQRNKAGIAEYNGIVVLDFDDIEDPQYSRELCKHDGRTLAAFISPSGNGIKVLVQTDCKSEVCHPIAWLRVANHYAEMLGEKIDQSGKDVSRLAFLSFDPEIYINDSPGTFLLGEIRSSEVADFQQALTQDPNELTVAGNRHQFLLSVSQRLANAGCNEQVIWAALRTTIEEQFDLSDGRTFDDTELRNIITSAIQKGDGKQLALDDAEDAELLARLEEEEENKEASREKLFEQLDSMDDALIDAINNGVEKVDCSFTSGLGLELQQAWEEREKRRNPDMNLIGITTFCASLMGSAYMTVNGVTPQAYSMIVVPSGGGKGHNYEMITELLNDTDYQAVEEASSGSAVATELQDKQSQLWCFDEFHQPLKNASNGQGVGANMQDMLTLFTRLWGVTGNRLLKTFSDSKKNIKAWNPAPNILASSQPESMRQFITGPLLTNGFMGRFLFYWTDQVGEFSGNSDFADIDDKLKGIIAQYCKVNKPNENEVALNRGFKPEKIAFTSEADRIMDNFRRKVEDIRQIILNPNDTKQNLVVLVERCFQMACKVALIYAWAEHAPPSSDQAYALQFYGHRSSPQGFQITERHAKIGCFYAMRSLGMLLAYIGDSFGDTPFQRNLTTLMHIVRQRGSSGIKLPQLYRKFAHRQSEVETYVRSLQSMGKVHLDAVDGIPILIDARAHRKQKRLA